MPGSKKEKGMSATTFLAPKKEKGKGAHKNEHAKKDKGNGARRQSDAPKNGKGKRIFFPFSYPFSFAFLSAGTLGVRHQIRFKLEVVFPGTTTPHNYPLFHP
jgi:Zn-dependent M28 family amino/carboxypeptidase